VNRWSVEKRLDCSNRGADNSNDSRKRICGIKGSWKWKSAGEIFFYARCRAPRKMILDKD